MAHLRQPSANHLPRGGGTNYRTFHERDVICCPYRLAHAQQLRLHNSPVRGFQSKHWGWWYLSIGVGFLLLAIVHQLQGAKLGAVVLRIIVAIGFVLLSWMQFRFGS